ncbi:hypothetical protein WR43_12595 [Mycolicibacter arupensis]|jgi:hypothetical protein|nr:hypothetical protein WR43_12595 [Mycolicibacter arupensis]OQZ94759.1 hypothetical protein BST15_15705 [Mycolicibacter arupensis]
MAIATFLPAYESRRFLRIEGNTLVQSADGWVLIALAVGIIVCAYKADSGDKNNRLAARILPLLGAGWLLLIWANKDARTLYPTGPEGEMIKDAPGEVGSLGIGFYLAAVGVGLAATGTRLLWNATKPPRDDFDDFDDEDADEDEPTPRRASGDLTPRNKATRKADDDE